MDVSPLVQAQTHARKAAKANTPTAAIDEHDLAAGQFASAAKGTDNSEAFRTLKLLEQHHEKLSRLLKLQNSHTAAKTPEVTVESIETNPIPPPQNNSQPQDSSPYRPASQSLPAAYRPTREVSSSIASKLASARGIPSNKQRRSGQASSPVLAQQHAEGKILSPPKSSRLAEAPLRSHRTPNASEKDKAAGHISAQPSATSVADAVPNSKEKISIPDDPQKSDEPFQRFYSAFESVFNKLSAPLAFAGLPLTTEDPAPTASTAQASKAKPQKRATAEPEYSQLFSKATLQALRDEPGAGNLGAAESFYVVPTTGGTMPYASILARHAGHTHLDRDNTGLSEEADEFVDARETPGPPSPLVSRGKKGASSIGPGGKTMEELHLENESLRGVLDEMSRRLWQFEMGAQMGSVALHQSIRASLRQSPVASVAGGEGDGKLNALEEQVTDAKKEVERLGKENEKLKGVVGRYRERWEKLKEGARVRREGTGTGKDEGDG